jgi:hypothetical protein
MAESFIEANNASMSFVGPDATRLFAATALRGAIDLYVKTGMKVNRAYTPTNMLAAAARITGQAYRRGQLPQASADLKAWIDAMRAALPVIDNRTA